MIIDGKNEIQQKLKKFESVRTLSLSPDKNITMKKGVDSGITLTDYLIASPDWCYWKVNEISNVSENMFTPRHLADITDKKLMIYITDQQAHYISSKYSAENNEFFLFWALCLDHNNPFIHLLYCDGNTKQPFLHNFRLNKKLILVDHFQVVTGLAISLLKSQKPDLAKQFWQNYNKAFYSDTDEE